MADSFIGTLLASYKNIVSSSCRKEYQKKIDGKAVIDEIARRFFGDTTMTLEEIKKNRELVNDIDWDMTPEEAVRLYLEWGNNWVRGNYVIRSKDDVTHYFVVNTWKKDPIIFLIRRNSENADELAEFKMPQRLEEKYISENGRLKGVFAVSGDVKKWLQRELKAA